MINSESMNVAFRLLLFVFVLEPPQLSKILGGTTEKEKNVPCVQ